MTSFLENQFCLISNKTFKLDKNSFFLFYFNFFCSFGNSFLSSSFQFVLSFVAFHSHLYLVSNSPVALVTLTSALPLHLTLPVPPVGLGVCFATVYPFFFVCSDEIDRTHTPRRTRAYLNTRRGWRLSGVQFLWGWRSIRAMVSKAEGPGRRDKAISLPQFLSKSVSSQSRQVTCGKTSILFDDLCVSF